MNKSKTVNSKSVNSKSKVSNYMNNDCLNIIMMNLRDIKDIVSFSSTCTIFHKLSKKLFTKEIGDITMRTRQVLAGIRMNEVFQKQNYCSFIAPMGWGKTITVINFILDSVERYNWKVHLYLPSSVVKVWMAELIKVGLLKSKPEDSKVLLLVPNRIHHKAKVDALLDAKKSVYTDHNIILSSCRAKHVNVFQGTDLVVIDECQKLKEYPSHKRLLTMTGEYKGRGDLVVKDPGYKETIPEIEFFYQTIETGDHLDFKAGDKKFHNFDIIAKESEYSIEIKKCLKHKKKTVIFTDCGTIGTTVKKIVGDIYPDRKLFHLKSSTVVVDRFHDFKGKCVLFISTASNEGLNILEENMVFIKPGMLSVTRIRQTIGRMKRPNNDYKNITCTFIGSGRIDYLKSYYAAVYSNVDWVKDFDDYPDVYFLRGAEIACRLLGKEIVNLDLIDGAVVFDSIRNNGRMDMVLEWWKNYKLETSILTPKTIELFYK